MRFLVQTLVTILDPVTLAVSLPAACIPRRWRTTVAAACLTAIAHTCLVALLDWSEHHVAGVRSSPSSLLGLRLASNFVAGFLLPLALRVIGLGVRRVARSAANQ
jgi:hypothetical protein